MSYSACLAYLREMSFRLELAGDKFRCGAYGRALESFAAAGSTHNYEALPGVGTSIRAELAQVLSGSTPEKLVRLRADGVPSTVAELTTLRGVNSKRALALHSQGISSLSDIARAVQNHVIADPDLISAYYASVAGASSLPRHHADSVFETVLPEVAGMPGVVDVQPCGGYRRKKSDIQTMDVLVVVKGPRAISGIVRGIGSALNAPVHTAGDRQATVPFDFGDHVRDMNLWFCGPSEAGCALVHHTGSAKFNKAIGAAAVAAGLRLTPHSVITPGESLQFPTEVELFSFLGIPNIPPELRDHIIDVTRPVPDVLNDVVADFRMFTDWSSGTASVPAMVASASGLHKIYGVCDQAGRKLSGERVREYIDSVHTCATAGTHAFAGIEFAVGHGGSVNAPLSVAECVDYVFLAVHDHPHTNTVARLASAAKIVRSAYPGKPLAIAHPTGRMFGVTSQASLDYKELFRLCAAENIALEINGSPSRLDLDDSVIVLAAKYRCKFICSSGATATDQVCQISNAVTLARRGLLEPSSVINSSNRRVRYWLSGSDLRGMP